MKQAILLHGTSGSDHDYFWFANTKQYLESNGYNVWWPALPSTEMPELHESLDFLTSNIPPIDENAIIIGHSSACPLLLTFLENAGVTINQVFLVSGFYDSLDDDGYSDRMLQGTEYKWDKISKSVNEIILINSDNDPWGCNDVQARHPAIKLNATLIMAAGQGHMGSISYDQPYKEFPLLKRLIEV